jgi:hypothetical protein
MIFWQCPTGSRQHIIVNTQLRNRHLPSAKTRYMHPGDKAYIWQGWGTMRGFWEMCHGSAGSSFNIRILNMLNAVW